MALRGNLRDFSLPDVFQLVTFSRKTGVLRITSESGALGSVWFREGDVFFASSNWRAELLGERLVRAQRITPQALDRALKLRAAEPQAGRRLGQILVDEGYITESVLESFVQEQIQDTIFDLMRWDEGDFDFEAMPDVVDEDIGLVVSIENVVMEGSRRLEEWNRIRRKIPSMEVVFKMATAPGEGTFEISLKPTEWQLLLLVDATRSVSELARETGRTDFEVARVLYGLFSAGLLEFASDEEIERNRARRAEREARLAEIEQKRRAEQQLIEQAAATVPPGPSDVAEAEVPPAPSAPAEIPTFLGVGTATPTEADQAALEEFMGAVLEQPAAATPAATEPTPAPPAQPYTPAEEPAFMSGVAPVADTSVAPEELIEDLLGMTPQPVPEPEPVAPAAPEVGPVPVPAPEPAAEEPPAIVVEAAAPPTVEDAAEVELVELEVTEERLPEPQPEPEPEPAEAATTAGEAAGLGFEHDLMALGLGELPSDLLEFAEKESASSAQTAEPAAASELAEAPEAPEASVAPEAGALEWIEEPAEAALETATEEPLVPPPGAEAAEEDAGELVIVQPGEEPPGEAVADDMDFSALIESLDVDADDFTDLGETSTEATLAERGFDEGLLRDESPVVPGKVISTDAFLSDITMDDLGFSGGLTDELSALTGAQRKGPVRPQASVNRLPEEGSALLKRDARVDKETLLKIIDGIENL